MADIGLAAVTSVLLVVGTIHFTGSETQAQVPPDPTECINDCLLIVDFNGDTVFNVDDVLLFVESYENQDPAFDKDGNVDVFDVLGYTQEVRDCIRGCVPSGP